MRFTTLACSFTPLFVASLAHAQAPGEVIDQPVAPEARCATAYVGGRDSVMSNRWAVGLSIGSMGLAPDGSPDANTEFAVGELALRFRATPHFELELAGGGGREQTSDGMEGDLEVKTVSLAARYRFRPEAAWNWYVMGGVGVAAITRHDATDQERKDATQPLGMLGVGVERRFQRFALQAELRAIGLDKHPEDASRDEVAAMTTSSTPTSADIKRSGGSLSIGLSYYF